MKSLFSTIVIMGLLSSLAHATGNDAQKYRKCMELVESNASEAVTYANDWIFSGMGKVPAGHCKALGLLGLGKAKDAANMLEKLVEDMVINGIMDPEQVKKDNQLRVQLYGQAALAWKAAKDYDKSYMAYSSALSGIGRTTSLTSDTLFYELYLERGTLQILRGQYKAAVEDLTLAIEKNDQQFEGFLQRAKAYRKRRYFLKARLDLRVAAKLEMDQPDILLESGILYREQEKKSKARLAWQKIIDLYPETDYAQLARTNINMIER